MIHRGQISDKTDIWALGLTFWEIMALMTPHLINQSSSDEIVALRYDDLAKSMDEYFSTVYGK